MAMDPDLSREDMPALFGRLASRDAAAFWEIWCRLLPRLRAWSRRRLAQAPGLSSTYDEDDALQSAPFLMLRSILRGNISPIAAEADFFRLFRTILDRRITAWSRRARRQVPLEPVPRGRLSKLGTLGADVPDSFDLLDSGLPKPEVEAIAKDEFFHLLEILGPALRTIAEWRLDGTTVEETAEKLGLSTRSVERLIRAIRDIWKLDRFDRGLDRASRRGSR